MGSRVRAGVLLIGCLGVLAVALSAASVAAKSSPKKMRLSCTATVYNVDFPKLSGLGFGDLHCSRPFGTGVQRARNKSSVVGSTVKVTGSFKNFFDDGTNSGTVRLSGPIGSGAITVKGSVRVIAGTGAYKHMRGTGRTTCTTTDAGKTFHCTVKGTATG